VANTGRTPTSFSVQSEAAAAVGGDVRAPVLFERRHASLRAGVLAESLDGYGTRVVRINCSASGGGGGPGKGYGTDDYNRDDFATDDGGGGVTSANRVYNPSFEDFVTPAQPAGGYFAQTECFAASTCVGSGVLTQMTRVVDSTVARTLGHSMRLTGYVPAPGSPASARQETIGILDGADKNPGGRALSLGNGTTVSLEVYVRAPPAPAGWPGITVSFVSSGFDRPCDFDLTKEVAQPWEWTRLACQRTMVASGSLSLGLAGAGNVWIDDLSAVVMA